jgi:peptidyl-prolyl cis-trans isomerase SurA
MSLPCFFLRGRRSSVTLKHKTWGVFLLTLALSHAQVASHAPTVFKPAPAAQRQSSQPGDTSQKPAPSAKPVARVNGSILTDSDLVREEYAIFPYARQHNGIPQDLAPQIRDGALKMIIFEELAYQEALRRNMTVPAAKLQSAQADFRTQFATPDEFNAFVQSDFHGSQQLLLDKIRRSLLIDAFLKIEVESKCVVTPAEVKAQYDRNPARFQIPETYTFQSISVLPPPNATAAQLKEKQARADDALRQAKGTRSAVEFGLLAEKISDDDYRVMMGQHKPVPADQLPPQVVKALGAMKPGEVSGLIQVDQAYTIVRLGEHKPAGKQKFEDVKAQLQKEMQETKRNQLRSALDQKLRAGAKIEEM